MQEYTATIVEHQRLGRWSRWALHAPALVNMDPGQYVAMRCAPPNSYDPLVRLPLWTADADPRGGTITVLLARDAPAWQFLARQPIGGSIDLLGPVGRGWQIAPTARTLAIVGTTEHAGALFGLAQRAVRRGLAVSLLLGADEPDAAPPPFLLPADAEYNVAQGTRNTEQGTGKQASKETKKQKRQQEADPIPNSQSKIENQLSDDTIRWADVLACALPLDQLTLVAQRIRAARLNWADGLAQALVLPPPVCHVGVCGVCAVPTRGGYRLACVDGPVFDLKELAR